MSGLVFLWFGLVLLLAALVAVLYTRMQLAGVDEKASAYKQQLDRVEIQLHELMQLQVSTQQRVEQLAADVLNREIYRSSDDRHQLAIRAAKEGQSLAEIVKIHGMGSDEAALIMALHAPPPAPGTRSELAAAMTDSR